MAMTTGQRSEVSSQYAREHLTRTVEPCTFTKAQLLAAVAAVDDWVDANQTSYNTALPVAFRNAATVAQKAALLCYVIQRRQGRLNVEG